jgi:anti-sigma factor RsiW
VEEIMLSCDEAATYIVRLADGDESLDTPARARLEAHLEACDQCRASLDTQRSVAAWLRSRPVDRVPADFAARLATRLDEEIRADRSTPSTWLGLADWRVWTLRLAPIAALLMLAVLLGSSSRDAPPTIDDWALASDDNPSAAVLLLQPGVTSDSLAESFVTGELPSANEGAGDVRQ